MPGLLATMLTTIRINTGYTTALLCERLGSNQVTTDARTRLDHVGYTPTVITGNGAQGGALVTSVLPAGRR